MFDDVIRSLRFSTAFEEESVDLGKLKHTAVPFSKNNFHDFSLETQGSVAFVDGGNAEILRSPTFSLQLCRVASVLFENGVRTKQHREEFFVLVNVVNNEFVAQTFGTDLNYSFKLDDEHFKSGMMNGSPSAVVSAIRRFAELQHAANLSADAVVLDGSLQQTYPFENSFFKKLQSKNVVGFCKTSSLLTKTGNSVVALMNLHQGRFAYHPVASLSDNMYSANISFARLHEKSNYVFKIDFQNEIDSKTLGLLAENSRDPIFLGYPYGLVLADKLARVSNEELEYVKQKFISKIKNEDLIRYLNALNAHDVLDSM